MALTASFIITGIAIGLLLLYAADVAAAGDDGIGFIPLDHMVRGIGLGGPALILPIAAFFISRKEPSKILGIMIIAVGIMALVGGAYVIANADPADAERVTISTLPIAAVGIFILGLGALKLKR